MTVFSYVIEHDLGFAPNPFSRVCTLGCCKPDIRKAVDLGDFILGTGAATQDLRGHLIYWMRVDEIISFDDYWNDPRFRWKKPNMAGTNYLRYGDNIYRRGPGGVFLQVDSFHSQEDGSPSRGDIKRDTGKTDRVLVGREFAYWGRSAIKLPDNLKCFVKKGPGHKCRFTKAQIARLMAWIQASPERGYIDEPADWQFLGKAKRSRKARKKS